MKLSAVIYNLCYKMSHVYELECKCLNLYKIFWINVTCHISGTHRHSLILIGL